MAFFRKYSFNLKILFCALILYWLISSNKLDLKKIALFIEEPRILFFHFSAWLFGFILFNSIRWRILLEAVGVHLQTFQAISLTAIGLFFNSFLPGSASGDGVKAYYIIKRNKDVSKTSLVFSVLFDRALAFYALFLMATLAILFTFSFEQTLKMRAVTFPVLGIFSVMTTLGLFFLIVPLRILKKNTLIKQKNILQLVTVLYHYRYQPRMVTKVFFYAILTQGLFFFYFCYIANFFNNNTISLNSLIIIYPLGLLSTLIPIAPGGLGVGHMAYETLFQYFNLKDGANVYNIFYVGSLCFNLLGIIPYILINQQDKNTSPLKQTEKIPLP